MNAFDVVSQPPMSWVYGAPPEVWTLVGHQIQGRTTFKALTQVCRGFRDIFIPFLYRRHVLQLHKYSASQLLAKPLPAELRHIKELEVILFDFRDGGVTYEIDMNDDYARSIAKMLKAMPNLRSFRWLDNSFDTGYEPSLILRNEEFLTTLKDCKNLSKLSIQFTSQYENDVVAVLNCSIPLTGFGHLTSLELYNFSGSEDQLIPDIARLLSDSTNLKKLGLGLAWDRDCSGTPEILIVDGDCDFLEKLCIQFGSQQQAVPLALETLALGHGMFLYESESPSAGNFLARLIKIGGLRNLHVFNGLLKVDEEDDEIESMECDWALLDGCTSLRQLSVSRLEYDVRQWLNSGANSVKELIVTDHYGMYDDDLDNFDALRLPQLSMLFTWELWVEKRVEEDAWSDTDSRGFESDTSQSVSSEPSPNLDRSIITVLDRLFDGGSHLTRLAICFNFESNWDHFSSHLEKLNRLTQLRLSSKSCHSGRFPTKESSLWPGIHKAKDIAYRYAQLLKLKCPSLQYIQIQSWAWYVTSPIGALLDPDADIYGQVELRQLEFEEKLAIELFAMDTFATQAGLPGPEEFHDELTEEENDRMDRLIEEVDAAFREGRPVRSREELSELWGEA